MTDHDGAELDDSFYMGLPLSYMAEISPDIIEMQATITDPSADTTESTLRLLEKIDTYEQENPESCYWDSIKRSVISDLLAVNQPDLAIDVFWTMTSGHEMAATLAEIQQQLDQSRITSLATELYAAAPYCANIGRTIQAIRDSFIAVHPASEITRSLNEYLIINGLEVDTIEGWIDSQTELYDDVNWSSVEKDLKDEEIWGNTPLENRLYLANLLLVAVEQLYRHDLTEEEAALLVGDMNQAEAILPAQQYTDIMRFQLASVAVDVGALKIGVTFASLIKQEDYLFHLVHKLDVQGDTAQAFQLASSMDDPALTMKLLIDTDWQDEERAFQLIDNLLYSDLDTIERRIGYFTMLRDCCAERDEFAEAAEIQGIINELKSEQS